jgi:hypothetical protein
MAVMKSMLSPQRRRLVEWMQEIGFGKFEGLVVRDREPVLDPPPKVIRETKFGAAENGARPERASRDFELKDAVLDLLRYFDELGDGTVEVLEIRHGLPFRLFAEAVLT